MPILVQGGGGVEQDATTRVVLGAARLETLGADDCVGKCVAERRVAGRIVEERGVTKH